jgi:DNA repair protein RadD
MLTRTPRWYQDGAVNSIFDYFNLGNKGNPVAALPTGTGKELVQTLLIQRILERWPRQRFVCATHVKELVEQNEAGMKENWPNAPTGIYSAGLGRKETQAPIIYCGIGSAVNNIESFGHRDLMIVDECHLMSGKEDSMYGKFIAGLKAINPYLKVIGLTATDYRADNGPLIGGGVFTDKCYDMTAMREFNLLMEQGFICPIRSTPTDTQVDLDGVDLFNQGAVEAATDIDSITNAAVEDIVRHGQSRRAWLTFAAGIKHAEHVADRMKMYGVQVAAIHGDLPKDRRDEIIRDFKSGRLRSVVAYNMMTTGFNYPGLDLIGMLRATGSTSLWVQMLGRLTRPFQGKEYGLVLDYAGNAKRLGPINDPCIPQRRGKKTIACVAPIKICPDCGYYNHTRATMCCNCPHIFDMRPKITAVAGIDEVLRTEAAQIEYFNVAFTTYGQKQAKTGNRPYLCVTYYCGAMGLQRFTEKIMLEHDGPAKNIGRDWWKQRYLGDNTARLPSSFVGYCPSTITEALTLTNNLKTPTKIRVHVNTKYPEVLGHQYN